jgi:hypothetical protein
MQQVTAKELSARRVTVDLDAQNPRVVEAELGCRDATDRAP